MKTPIRISGGLIWLSTLIVTLMLFGQTVWSQSGESEASFSGDIELPVTQTIFDDAEQFVPPEELPIVDTYIKDDLAASPEAIADDMGAVMVTPDGEISTMEVDPAELQLMEQAIDEMEAGAEGTIEMDGGGDSDFVDDESTAESVIGKDTRVRIHNTKK